LWALEIGILTLSVSENGILSLWEAENEIE
jgi:hypothetical protein